MAITPSALKKWTKGAGHDAVDPDDEPDVPPEEETDDEDGGGDQNALWAGTDERSAEELAELDDDEVDDFTGWLEENEPDLYEAAGAYFDAIEEGGSLADALKTLKAAEQYLTPEYPKMSPEQRADVAAKLKELHPTDRDRAIAVAFARVRKAEDEDEPDEDEPDEDEPDEDEGEGE